uniref:Cytochrome c biogenesis protein CcsA n=1 Tax=Chloromonas perforata TaxID=51730 RepID=A0A0S2LNP1_9CHLO|nr:heme attachment to plastid cytochrome c [Chloromonas perforata]
MTLQNSLANYSFLTLLGSMIFYWIETSFTGVNLVKKNVDLPETLRDSESLILIHNKQTQPRSLLVSPSSLQEQSNPFPFPEGKGKERSNPFLKGLDIFRFTLPLSKLNGEGEEIGFLKNDKSVWSPAKYGIFISNILLGLLLLLRWKESGHFPLSNLYESLMFLSWCFTGLHLYIDNYTSLPTSLQKENNEFVRKLLGAITTPSALLTNAFATFTLPKEMQEAAPLVPALQSNWLMMHVTVMILSYAALILGSLMSIAFLIVTAEKKQVVSLSLSDIHQEGTNAFITGGKSQVLQESTIALTLDNLSYRILGIGFPLLTIGILSGAVWANEAWGSYWSWDPKETWALLTWLIFAIYLHTRLSKGWEGKKPAIIASLGFVIVWMCYLGVNLIGEGLHSYGWIVQS